MDHSIIDDLLCKHHLRLVTKSIYTDTRRLVLIDNTLHIILDHKLTASDFGRISSNPNPLPFDIHETDEQRVIDMFPSIFSTYDNISIHVALSEQLYIPDNDE